jgi:hypothetical protein
MAWTMLLSAALVVAVTAAEADDRRRLQAVSCGCQACMDTGTPVETCASFGLDCYCRICLDAGCNSIDDCMSFGLDCSCTRGGGPDSSGSTDGTTSGNAGGGGADCTDDPAWRSVSNSGCETYYEGGSNGRRDANGAPIYCGGADPRDGRPAAEACPAACGACTGGDPVPTCTDDSTWRKAGYPDQGCGSYAFGEINGGHAAWKDGQASPFCFVAGVDGRSATEACGCTCSDDSTGGTSPPPPTPLSPPTPPPLRPPPPPPPRCDLAGRTAAVNTVCCSAAGCGTAGATPATCTSECATTFLPFWSDCSSAVQSAGSFQQVSYTRVDPPRPQHRPHGEPKALTCVRHCATDAARYVQ